MQMRELSAIAEGLKNAPRGRLLNNYKVNYYKVNYYKVKSKGYDRNLIASCLVAEGKREKKRRIGKFHATFSSSNVFKAYNFS